jgi:hypothetical protein
MAGEFDKCNFCKYRYDDDLCYMECARGIHSLYEPDKNAFKECSKKENLSVADIIALVNMS